MTLSSETIAAAFPSDAPPMSLSGDDADLEQYWESGDFIRSLRGRQWPTIARPEVFWAVCADPLIWLCYMPIDWFAYYLPAMMTVAIESADSRAENLRGNLIDFVRPRKHATDRNMRVAAALQSRLTESQKAIVRSFLDKFADPV
jgi:hypothetical protein